MDVGLPVPRTTTSYSGAISSMVATLNDSNYYDLEI
jgi:hypothetical protein